MFCIYLIILRLEKELDSILIVAIVSLVYKIAHKK